MKKIIYLMASVITMAFCACTDNKDEITLKLGQDDANEATINRIGGTLLVPVTTNGNWTATLSEDCDWAFLVQSYGNGNAQLELDVDYLNPSVEDADRITTLSVTVGNKTQEIRIRQYVGIEDGVNEAYLDANGFNDLYITRGLGVGFNIVPTQNNLTLTKSPIVDRTSLNKLVQADDYYRSIITENTDPTTIGYAGPTENFHHDAQHLGITADIQVTYGLFKLKIAGAYTLGQENNRQNYTFYSSYQVPRVRATLNVPDLEDIMDYDDLSKVAFTRGFMKARKQVIDRMEKESESASFETDRSLLAEGDPATWKKYADLASVIKNLDNKYGPFYIASTLLGGNLTMEIKCDTTTVSESTKVSGAISCAITEGLLQVKADISADYSKIATDVLKNGTYSFTVRGGSESTQTGINDAMGFDKARIDIYNIRRKINDWVESIPTDLTSKEAYERIAVNEQGIAPVWGLFPIEYQRVIRGYFINVYKDKETLVDIEDF